MSEINFTKMQGAGNDFIMLDNRENIFADNIKVDLVKEMTTRALSIGADGVVFIENDDEFDFGWDFYNADGSSAEMCGNGARCAAVFAQHIGVASGDMTFRTIAGPIHAKVNGERATVRLTDAPLPVQTEDLKLSHSGGNVFSINTGVPHAVIAVNNINDIDIVPAGAEIRYHPLFYPAGTNVNFMAQEGESAVAIRTYERGVENETLACGTGAVACAIVATSAYGMTSPIAVRTHSDATLNISFEITESGVTNVDLEGPAETVYAGTFRTELV